MRWIYMGNEIWTFVSTGVLKASKNRGHWRHSIGKEPGIPYDTQGQSNTILEDNTIVKVRAA